MKYSIKVKYGFEVSDTDLTEVLRGINRDYSVNQSGNLPKTNSKQNCYGWHLKYTAQLICKKWVESIQLEI